MPAPDAVDRTNAILHPTNHPTPGRDPAGHAGDMSSDLADFIAGDPTVVDLPEDGLQLLDCHPSEGDMRAEVLAGLSRTPQKTLPTKYLYDRRGSELFDQITELDAYYPTRTELAILDERLAEIAGLVGPDAAIVEPGAGSSLKIRRLLDALDRPFAYAPVEISRTHVIASARALADDYPDLTVAPVCADFTGFIALPDAVREAPGKRVVFFPGSTIGNFEAPMRRAMLERFAEIVGEDGLLLIGADLIKDTRTLHAAYDDPDGVTAAFNLNYLERLNRELDADFDLARWSHQAVVSRERSRVELSVRSERAQTVRVADHAFEFAEHETIHTESSHKFTEQSFDAEVTAAGFTKRLGRWTDSSDLFSVSLYARR
ncbi:MAG: L-histidine N(alpha)-methyltransferase [Planctomycetota bacterium]